MGANDKSMAKAVVFKGFCVCLWFVRSPFKTMGLELRVEEVNTQRLQQRDKKRTTRKIKRKCHYIRRTKEGL